LFSIELVVTTFFILCERLKGENRKWKRGEEWFGFHET